MNPQLYFSPEKKKKSEREKLFLTDVWVEGERERWGCVCFLTCADKNLHAQVKISFFNPGSMKLQCMFKNWLFFSIDMNKHKEELLIILSGKLQEMYK